MQYFRPWLRHQPETPCISMRHCRRCRYASVDESRQDWRLCLGYQCPALWESSAHKPLPANVVPCNYSCPGIHYIHYNRIARSSSDTHIAPIEPPFVGCARSRVEGYYKPIKMQYEARCCLTFVSNRDRKVCYVADTAHGRCSLLRNTSSFFRGDQAKTNGI